MNYLAHAYLSFNDPDILIGNMISDFVKGKKKFDYSQGILNGIMLHREIDTFTDNHPEVKKAKELFRPAYRLYSGAFTDITFDYFLANDKNEFPNAETLNTFCKDVYVHLKTNYSVLPPPMKSMLPYMEKENWLYNYQFKWGIQKSFEGLVRRAAYLKESQKALDIFISNTDILRSYYENFFPDLKEYIANPYLILSNNSSRFPKKNI